MKPLRELHHGMLLDSKSVMDDAMPDLAQIKELIPECLHDRFDKIIADFEDTLCCCDVASDYEEKP